MVRSTTQVEPPVPLPKNRSTFVVCGGCSLPEAGIKNEDERCGGGLVFEPATSRHCQQATYQHRFGDNS